MRGLFPLLLVLATSANAKCLTNDRWVGYDKVQHVTVGLFIGAGVTAQTGDPLKGFAAGTAVGALKELADARGSGTCSLQDFAVTAIGAAAGAYGSAWILSHSQGKTSLTYRSTF